MLLNYSPTLCHKKAIVKPETICQIPHQAATKPIPPTSYS